MCVVPRRHQGGWLYSRPCVSLAFPVVSEVDERLGTEEGEAAVQSLRGLCEGPAFGLGLTEELLPLDGASHPSFCHCNKMPKAGHFVKK